MKLGIAFLMSNLLLFANANAETPQVDSYDLTKLNKGNTCQSVRQLTLAQKTLNFFHALNAYRPLDLKSQMSMFSKDIEIFHMSLAVLAQVAGPGKLPPFITPGPFGADSYPDVLAFLAYANDPESRITTPIRVDCTDENTVIVTNLAYGKQVKRDADGYITHGIDYVLPSTKIFVFTESELMSRIYIDVDPQASFNLRKSLGEISNGPATIARDESKRATLPELIQLYRESAGLPNNKP